MKTLIVVRDRNGKLRYHTELSYPQLLRGTNDEQFHGWLARSGYIRIEAYDDDQIAGTYVAKSTVR